MRTIDWKSQQLTKFEKNFYVEDKRVTARSDREVHDFRKKKEIAVSGNFLDLTLEINIRT